MRKKIVALMFAAMTIMGFNVVYGSETASIVCTQTSDYEIAVSGKGAPDSDWFVTVLAPGISKKDFSFTNDFEQNAKSLVWIGQGRTDGDGRFSDKFNINGKVGTYSVFYTVGNEKIDNAEFTYVNIDNYIKAIKLLNETVANKDKTPEDFVNALTENAENVNFFADDICDDKTMVARMFYNECKRDKLDENIETALETNAVTYRRAALIAALNGGRCDNLFAYKDLILSDDLTKSLNTLLSGNEFLTDATVQKSVTKRLYQKEIKDAVELNVNLYSQITLESVENFVGLSTVKNVINMFSPITKIDISGISDYKLNSLCSKIYADCDELKKAIDNLKESGSTSSEGSSGGGGKYNPPTATGTNIGDREPIPNDIYTDLDDVIWARNAIVTLSNKGILKGVGDNKFAPNTLVTREEFVKMLVCAFGDKTQTVKETNFSDVDPNEWYAEFVFAAVESGIVNGKGDGTFGVGENITRQDMAAMAYRAALKNISPDDESDIFDDFDSVDAYAKGAVAVMAQKGIINGKGNRMFCPLDNATRAEAAKVIFEIIQLVY